MSQSKKLLDHIADRDLRNDRQGKTVISARTFHEQGLGDRLGLVESGSAWRTAGFDAALGEGLEQRDPGQHADHALFVVDHGQRLGRVGTQGQEIIEVHVLPAR